MYVTHCFVLCRLETYAMPIVTDLYRQIDVVVVVVVAVVVVVVVVVVLFLN